MMVPVTRNRSSETHSAVQFDSPVDDINLELVKGVVLTCDGTFKF